MKRLAAFLLIAACSGPPDEPGNAIQLGQDALTYWPDSGSAWRTASPEQVGIDASAISSLVSRLRAGTYGAVDGIVIVRKGYIVTDEYFGRWAADSIHEMQSVTKSVTSLVTGIAISRGNVSGTDAKMVDVLQRYQPIANLDDRKRAMTVRDVLTMRTGLAWSEDPYAGSPLEQLNNLSSDWMKFVIDWPMGEQPGTHWVYNSGGVIALGGAIGLAAQMNTADYARQYLLRPIGVNDDKWYRGYPDLLPHMGGGLVMRTRSLARIGYLVLRNGKWKDQQIVPESWIRESTRASVFPGRIFNGRSFDYGYLWWIFPLDGVTGVQRAPEDVVTTASGANGQWLFIVPKYDLVVAVNSTIPNGPDRALEILFNTIIPAMH